jgi:DnaA-homolog protein
MHDSRQQLLLNIRPPQIPTFDNFVVGSNAELLAALRNMTASIYLWGSKGCGRTHLLSAVASAEGVAVLPAASVSGDFSPSADSLVVVDDVEGLSPEAQIALFRCFNDARLKRLRFLLSGSSSPLQLPCRDDLRTRIAQTLIYEIKLPSDSDKASALLYHAAQRGMRVDDHIIDYLLHHGRRDLPSLMAVLDALDQLSLEQQRPVTLPLLREILQMQLV